MCVCVYCLLSAIFCIIFTLSVSVCASCCRTRFFFFFVCALQTFYPSNNFFSEKKRIIWLLIFAVPIACYLNNKKRFFRLTEKSQSVVYLRWNAVKRVSFFFNNTLLFSHIIKNDLYIWADLWRWTLACKHCLSQRHIIYYIFRLTATSTFSTFSLPSRSIKLWCHHWCFCCCCRCCCRCCCACDTSGTVLREQKSRCSNIYSRQICHRKQCFPETLQ